MINAPIYRAKKTDSDEYVEGFYYPCDKRHYIATSIRKSMLDITENNIYRIDQSTLSINFEDMIDSEGTKIFASINEDGKGGDNLDVLDCEACLYVASYISSYRGFCVKNVNPKDDEWEYDSFDSCDVKVTGIQK